jgi:hypothetical protein
MRNARFLKGRFGMAPHFRLIQHQKQLGSDFVPVAHHQTTKSDSKIGDMLWEDRCRPSGPSTANTLRDK